MDNPLLYAVWDLDDERKVVTVHLCVEAGIDFHSDVPGMTECLCAHFLLDTTHSRATKLEGIFAESWWFCKVCKLRAQHLLAQAGALLGDKRQVAEIARGARGGRVGT